MDPYKTLGVRRNASAKSITKAYRKLCLDHHPDRGGDPTRFAEVQLAYECLSDAARRKVYDETGNLGGPTVSEYAIVGSVLANILPACIHQAMEQGADVRKVDMAALAKKLLGAAQIELRKKERKCIEYRLAWEATLDRWTNESDTAGLLAGITRTNIERMKENEQKATTELERITTTIKFIESAKYRFDQMAGWGFTDSTSTTSSTNRFYLV